MKKITVLAALVAFINPTYASSSDKSLLLTNEQDNTNLASSTAANLEGQDQDDVNTKASPPLDIGMGSLNTPATKAAAKAETVRLAEVAAEATRLTEAAAKAETVRLAEATRLAEVARLAALEKAAAQAPKPTSASHILFHSPVASAPVLKSHASVG